MYTLRPFRVEDAAGEPEIVQEIIRDGDPIVGVTVEDNGNVVAYGGVRLISGHHWVFFNLEDEVARRPVLLHRTTTAAILALGRAGVGPIFTFCDKSKPRAEAWLQRLGFRPLRDDEKSAVVLAAEKQVNHESWIWEG